MTYNTNINQIILNEYRVTETIKEDQIFQWLSAVHIKSGHFVFLQTLKIMVGLKEIKDLFNYFDQLHVVSRKSMVVPEQVLQDDQNNLVMVYSNYPQQTMENYLQMSSDSLETGWEQASEIVFALHNRQLTHGLILPDSLLVEGNRIKLAGFGYAPLINAGNPTVLQAYKNFIAPEILIGGKTSSASDAYSLAQTIVYWEPLLIDSDWFKKATQIEVTARFQRMRDFYSYLSVALQQLKQKNNESKQESNGSILVPKIGGDSRKEPPPTSGTEGSRNDHYNSGVQEKIQKSLLKGQRLDLSSVQVNEENLIIGVGWDKHSKVDIDTAVFLLTVNGKVSGDEDVIFYGQKSSVDGQVRLLAGKNEDFNQVILNLKNLNKEYQRIVISISVYEAEARGVSLGEIQSIYCRIINSEGQEILRYDVNEGLTMETALVITEIYRYQEQWKIAAVGSGFNGGLRALCKSYGVEVK